MQTRTCVDVHAAKGRAVKGGPRLSIHVNHAWIIKENPRESIRLQPRRYCSQACCRSPSPGAAAGLKLVGGQLGVLLLVVFIHRQLRLLTAQKHFHEATFSLFGEGKVLVNYKCVFCII